MDLPLSFQALGHVRTPWADKFGVPRQPGLADVICTVELRGPWAVAEAMREIEAASHLWLVTVFDKVPAGQWSPTVRPPRLGGNQRIGVFASRSPFRPNPIGLSCVAFESWKGVTAGIDLLVRGADCVDGTPVIDIKPLVPYVDCPAKAHLAWAENAPEALKQEISWSEEALQTLQRLRPAKKMSNLRREVEATLRCDPRPPFHQDSARNYHLPLSSGWDLSFSIAENQIQIHSLRSIAKLAQFGRVE